MVEDAGKTVKISVSQSSQDSAADKSDVLKQRAHTEPVPASESVEEKTHEEEGEVDPLVAARKEAAENRDRWMRAVADFENYKKRSLQEKSKLLKYKHEELLRDLLAVVDNIDRALGHCEQGGRSDPVADGVCVISDMFHNLLSKYGVTEIESLGKTLDPNVHEAVATAPVPGEAPNTVVEVMEKGYMYHDRLLRPAKVIVSAAS